MSISKILKRKLNESADLVDEGLRNLTMFSEKSPHADNCTYSLGAGGKRIRPFLVFQACSALGGETASALPSACAVEMIHTYSLIHDDLPGMDNDDLRRGKPTLHRICGREKALFAGDILLMQALREVLRTPLPSTVTRLMAERLVLAAGASMLVGGQFMDMYHPSIADSAWTERMIRGKTSAMIRVSMELGALSAGLSPGELASISSIGDDIGWLFQLTDDILDVTGTATEMGKAVAKDACMGKCNPVTALGLSRARELACETALSISQRLEALPGDWSGTVELVDYLPERRK